MYDKKSIRNSRKETIEIIVFIGPINFQMNICTTYGAVLILRRQPRGEGTML